MRLCKELVELRPEIVMTHGEYFAVCDDNHHVVWRRDAWQHLSDVFVDTSTYTIAQHGAFEHFFAYYYRYTSVFAPRIGRCFERGAA